MPAKRPITSRSTALLGAFFLLLSTLLASGPAQATSYVLMTDEALVDQTPTVIVGRILSKDNSPAAGLPATDYLVEVERVLKGGIPGTTVVVRVPGGVGPDGKGITVFGAPQFAEDSRAVLFLGPNPDGAFRIRHLMMGAFHAFEHEGRSFLLRNFTDTTEVSLEALGIGRPTGTRAPSKAPRDLERFAAWIADRAAGNRREVDYFEAVPASVVNRTRDRFGLIEDDGKKMRWFSFDNGGAEEFRLGPGGQPGLDAQQLNTAVQNGMGAWNNIGNARIRYRRSTAPGPNTGFQEFDGINTIIFSDPNGVIGGPFDCRDGGTLAVASPWWDLTVTERWQGEEFLRILGADVITNAGISCVFTGSPRNRFNAVSTAAELIGHELGHTLGIGHSSMNEDEPNEALREALMYFSLKGDGRGAQVNGDDIAAARRLYRANAPAPAAPAAPTNLEVEVLSPTSVRLRWTDNSDNETRFQVQLRADGEVNFTPVQNGVAPNSETVVVDGLTPQTVYEFRVRAFNGGTASGFSNTVTATTRSAAPNAPTGLIALPVTRTQIELVWADQASGEDEFVVQARSPESDWQVVATVPLNTETVKISGLTAETPYTFRVRARNDQGASPFSNEASATTLGATGPCRQDDRSLCLLDERFEVRVHYKDQFNGGNGVGTAVSVPGSDLSGLFYFFNAANIELIVKMLDGRPLNGFVWSFYGALSTVEYWVTIRDTQEENEQITYHNPPDELCGLADVKSFPRIDVQPTEVVAPGPRLILDGFPKISKADAVMQFAAGDAGITGTCVPGPNALCLLDNRFRVEVSWDNPRAPFNSGVGTVAPVATVQSDETGFFWFFTEDNIELVVKMLDGRAINGNYWFFYGALSDVEYDIRVTDTVGSTSKTYHNEPLNLCGQADINAF